MRSGPASGLKVQRLHEFSPRGKQVAERFDRDDFWHHPNFSQPSDTAINFEFFLLSRDEIRRSRIINGKRIIRIPLPFRGKFKFDFDVRVLEFADLPFGLGVIVSPMSPMEEEDSCYSLGGPGCFDGQGNAYGICACYPIPKELGELILQSLDYQTTS